MVKAELFMIKSNKLGEDPLCHPVEETFCRIDFEGEIFTADN